MGYSQFGAGVIKYTTVGVKLYTLLVFVLIGAVGVRLLGHSHIHTRDEQ